MLGRLSAIGLLLALGACTTTTPPSPESASTGTRFPSSAAAEHKEPTIAAPAPPSVLDEAQNTADWSRYLPEILPALRACLAKATAPAHVLNAQPLANAQVRAWIVDGSGQRWDCQALLSGSQVNTWQVLAKDTVVALGAPQLILEPQSAPSGSCWQNERLKDANGQAIGWLAYPQCQTQR